jgi:ribonucleoside-diphosphate reductase beta chain
MATTTITLGDRQFHLDRNKAEAAYSAKRVINGRQTMFFNILPLKYQWAYSLYKTMKANHWEPEDVQMQKDCEQWRDLAGIADIERWIIKMGIGYFSAAEGIACCARGRHRARTQARARSPRARGEHPCG